MNYIKHLTGFFEKVAVDRTLNPTHISLYIALFQFWNCNRFKNPISINRDEIMRISKISSKGTYHKCLKNLHSLGYIIYEPSYNPFKGSHVYLVNFSEDLKPLLKNERKPKNEPLAELVNEQATNKSCASTETSCEQVVVPSINYINNTNIINKKNVLNLDEQAKKNNEVVTAKKEALLEKNNGIPGKIELTQKEKSSAKKEKKEMPEKIVNEKEKSSSPSFADYNAEHTETSRQKSSAKKEKEEFVFPSVVEGPKLDEVISYFLNQNFPHLEANKFYNYFKSVGWLVGGKIPMIDWKAAAQNWMINATKFRTQEQQPNRAKQLNTATDKDYSEPL